MLGAPEISISAAGFASKSGDPRALLDQLSALGARGVALDVSLPGLRPRELGRSALRDLAASLRRRELELTGLDLWIPSDYYVAADRSHRAVEAVAQAAEMSAQLASLVGERSQPIVSVLLPSDFDSSARSILSDSAQRVGATIADHRLIDTEHRNTKQAGVEQTEAAQPDPPAPAPGIGIGIDPVFCLTDGRSPAKAIARAGRSLACARLSDTSAMGRCVVGAPGGKLDLTGYLGALLVSELVWVTLDVRGLPDPAQAARRAMRAWGDAGTI